MSEARLSCSAQAAIRTFPCMRKCLFLRVQQYLTYTTIVPCGLHTACAVEALLFLFPCGRPALGQAKLLIFYTFSLALRKSVAMWAQLGCRSHGQLHRQRY